LEPLQNTEPESLQIAENWTTVAKRLQETYPHLTNIDLHYEPGKENELIYAIQNRLYLKRNEVIELIKHMQDNTSNVHKYKLTRVPGKNLFAGSINIFDKNKRAKLYALFKGLF
jgi:hypothetical protein